MRGSLLALCTSTLAALLVSGQVMAQQACRLEVVDGAFDYRRQDPEAVRHKRRVEGAHFTQSVRMGIQGNTGSLMGDLDYTLRHFPNHHQALMVLIKHQLDEEFNRKRGGLRKDRSWESIDCYLKRARMIAPDDAGIMLIDGIYNYYIKNFDEAEKSYKKALEMTSHPKQRVEIYYNLGLMYAERGDYPSAKHYADKAYALNYPLPGLKNKLARMKKE